MPIYKRQINTQPFERSSLKEVVLSELEELCNAIKNGSATIMNRTTDFNYSNHEASTMIMAVEVCYVSDPKHTLADEYLNESLNYNPNTHQWEIN